MMLDLLCITPTTLFQMEEDQQSNEGIVLPALLAKEAALAPQTFKESIPCTVALMEALTAQTIINIVPIGPGKDFAPIIMLHG